MYFWNHFDKHQHETFNCLSFLHCRRIGRPSWSWNLEKWFRGCRSWRIQIRVSVKKKWNWNSEINWNKWSIFETNVLISCLFTLQLRNKWWTKTRRTSWIKECWNWRGSYLRQGIILLRWRWWSNIHSHIHRWWERFPTLSRSFASCPNCINITTCQSLYYNS